MKRQSGSIRNGICLLVSLMIIYSCSSPNESSTVSEPVVITRPETYTVEIKQMQFVPAELKVKEGDAVVFVNHDLVAHDVTEAGEKKWNSSALQDGGSWTLIATESSDYYCSIHPVMKGKIIVE